MLELPEGLRRALRNQLLALNYHALLQVIRLLLEKMRFEDVQLAGRTGFVGRNSAGGFDLLAYRPVAGGGRRKVLIQVKQYAPGHLIYRAAINELRGVCLGHQAAEGLLISTSGFSPSLSASALASASLIPVELMDGDRLTELMAIYRVGVRRDASAQTRFGAPLIVDRAFFADLEQRFKGVARALPGTHEVYGLLVSVKRRTRRTHA